MQSVPITTKVVISNPVHGEVYIYVLETTLCDKVGQWLNDKSMVSYINKTDCHNIAEILLIVELSIINQNQTKPATIDANRSPSYVNAFLECDKIEQL